MLVKICQPTQDYPYVSFLLSSALYHCKYNLSCAAVHEFSEILTTVTVNYRNQVTAVAGAGFEPTSSGYEPAENTIFSTPLYYFIFFVYFFYLLLFLQMLSTLVIVLLFVLHLLYSCFLFKSTNFILLFQVLFQLL